MINTYRITCLFFLSLFITTGCGPFKNKKVASPIEDIPIPIPIPIKNINCRLVKSMDNIKDVGRDSDERCLPGNNELQNQQWHLMNVGQNSFSRQGGISGYDLNLWAAHRASVLGENINIGIVDTGIWLEHPNLLNNVQAVSPGWNFRTKNEDIRPINNESHGTAVAGILASVDNDIGTKGVAPMAKIQGYNLIGDEVEQNYTNWRKSHGLELVNKASNNNAFNKIYNLSFGSENTQLEPYSLIQVMKDENLIYMTNEYDVMYVKAAGNEYKDYLYDGMYFFTSYSLLAEPYNIPVGISTINDISNNFYGYLVVSAIDAFGKISDYSSVGSNIFISAPGGGYGEYGPAIVTTDLPGCDKGQNTTTGDHINKLHGGNKHDPDCNYTATMNGTSSAAPNVSGSIALIMSANPNLKQRDIRDILIKGATRIDEYYPAIEGKYYYNPDNDGFYDTYTAIEPWERNNAGFWYSPLYGFGLVDVNKSLILAKTHEPLPDMKISSWIDTSDDKIEIPDNGIHIVSSITDVNNLTVESVQVNLTFDHERMSDLLVKLISPSGTSSTLLSPHSAIIFSSEEKSYDDTSNSTLFLSHKFYGESSEGDWKLVVSDMSKKVEVYYIDDFYSTLSLDKDNQNPRIMTVKNNRVNGILNSWSLRIFGH
ncbi:MULTISPECIES: S8 family serine peptidase [unclassified Aliivibrio]|uniref:S8 family serine peptidase n=1 Tax=unclassified Aliivibrio TaxID=2645654 RepID=UPI0009F49CDD|nr:MULTISPECIES: S8 family serine peptidase [unclassified Aliivibrio]